MNNYNKLNIIMNIIFFIGIIIYTIKRIIEYHSLTSFLLLLPLLLILIYFNYLKLKLFFSFLNKDNEKSFEEMRKENLEYIANMPINPIKNFKYGLNSLKSKEFLFFGNTLLNMIMGMYLIGLITYNNYDNSISLSGIITILLFPLLIISVIFMSKKTARATLIYEENLEEDIKKGKKEGVMDSLNWKSILIIFLITPLILMVLFGVFALIFLLFK